MCLRGRIVKELYDELERTCMDRIEPTPGGPVFAVIVGVLWAMAQGVLESGLVLLECKDGKWETIGTIFRYTKRTTCMK